MDLDRVLQEYRSSLEDSLRIAIDSVNDTNLEKLHEMMAYHLGWIGEGSGAQATGKRIRPLLLLITTQAAGGNWQKALPAAVAVELIHNFSLIHDDIEDNSKIRRGRPTVWAKWGVPLAINTGDSMFTLAHLAMLELEEDKKTQTKLEAIKTLQQTCLQLTQGQHLDISYENEDILPIEAYWPMVQGKTAALISACTKIGALIAGVDKHVWEIYQRFGQDLGLAFQVMDDFLGIWGDAVKTGKSSASDLVAGKKSLPVLYGLAENGDFAKRWRSGQIKPEEVPGLAKRLEHEGAKEFTLKQANRLTDSALSALQLARPQGEAGKVLLQLTNKLLYRDI